MAGGLVQHLIGRWCAKIHNTNAIGRSNHRSFLFATVRAADRIALPRWKAHNSCQFLEQQYIVELNFHFTIRWSGKTYFSHSLEMHDYDWLVEHSQRFSIKLRSQFGPFHLINYPNGDTGADEWRLIDINSDRHIWISCKVPAHRLREHRARHDEN